MSEVKVLSSKLMPLIKELIDEGKSVQFKISGNSMLPFFKHHKTQVIVIRKESYSKGDAVLYQCKDKYILHRIIKVTQDFYLICGDALKTIEEIPKTDVLGYVSAYEGKHKTIQHTSKLYKFKVSLWILLKPFRRVLLKIYVRK